MEMAATGRAAAAWRVASRGSRAWGVIGVAAIPAKRCRHRRKLLVCSPSRLQNPVTDSPLPSKRPNTSAQACALKCRRVLVFASIVVVIHRVADVGHCRKPPLAVEERRRLTGYVQTNFLPGRTFADFDELNAQALRWCIEVANAKPKRDLGASPEDAYRQELAHLRPLPAVLPPVYEVLDRVVDLYGFVSVDTNRYSVPERLVGKTVTVYKHYGEVQIHHRGAPVATHARLLNQRDARHVIAGHHTLPQRAPREPALEQLLLRGEHEVLQRYAAALKARPHGHGVRALRRLLQIKRTYPREPFLAAVQQALKFGLF